MARAQRGLVIEDSVKQSREARVDSLIADAKKRLEAGEATRALDLYRQAADELPGAPWLQHRTAELARRLKQREVAIVYFRRAATAFQMAEFAKRAVAPLRQAWTLSVDGLPGTSRSLVDLAGELIQLQRRLGYASDATVTFERTNAALRASGFSELGAHLLAPAPRGSALEAAPQSGAKPTVTAASSRPPRFNQG
jgi:hypothetical protein